MHIHVYKFTRAHTHTLAHTHTHSHTHMHTHDTYIFTQASSAVMMEAQKGLLGNLKKQGCMSTARIALKKLRVAHRLESNVVDNDDLQVSSLCMHVCMNDFYAHGTQKAAHSYIDT